MVEAWEKKPGKTLDAFTTRVREFFIPVTQKVIFQKTKSSWRLTFTLKFVKLKNFLTENYYTNFTLYVCEEQLHCSHKLKCNSVYHIHKGTEVFSIIFSIIKYSYSLLYFIFFIIRYYPRTTGDERI